MGVVLRNHAVRQRHRRNDTAPAASCAAGADFDISYVPKHTFELD